MVLLTNWRNSLKLMLFLSLSGWRDDTTCQLVKSLTGWVIGSVIGYLTVVKSKHQFKVQENIAKPLTFRTTSFWFSFCWDCQEVSRDGNSKTSNFYPFLCLSTSFYEVTREIEYINVSWLLIARVCQKCY